jgi:hypothetical protein
MDPSIDQKMATDRNGSTPACRCARKRTHAEMSAVGEHLRLSAAMSRHSPVCSKADLQRRIRSPRGSSGTSIFVGDYRTAAEPVRTSKIPQSMRGKLRADKQMQVRLARGRTYLPPYCAPRTLASFCLTPVPTPQASGMIAFGQELPYSQVTESGRSMALSTQRGSSRRICRLLTRPL